MINPVRAVAPVVPDVLPVEKTVLHDGNAFLNALVGTMLMPLGDVKVSHMGNSSSPKKELTCLITLSAVCCSLGNLCAW